MIGRTISHYEILELLHKGAMGDVYKARDLEKKRFVAIKFIRSSMFASERDQTRFLQDARAVAELDHPSICKVHEVVEAGEYIFVVTAFILGKNLKEVIDAFPMDFNSAVDRAIQLAEGLQAAHSVNAVHRDFRSANILVTTVGGARITDFGLIRSPSEDPERNREEAAAAAAYKSPEQLEGGEVDQQSDVWSLGVVMYELITGQLPFRGRAESSVIHSILNDEPAPASSVRRDTPKALERVLTKALSKDWEGRYHGADALLEDLRPIQTALLTGEEIPDPEPKPKPEAPQATHKQVVDVVEKLRPRAVPRWVKSKATWAVAAALVVVGAVFLFYPKSGIPFDERDWAVVADFDNFTGETVFDRSLDAALAVSLEQSRYVNVIPRRRAREAMLRMGMADVERINGATAREIARREGIRMIVVPTATSAGDTYKLTADIKDAETGDVWFSEVIQAEGQGEVLFVLNELADKIRADLGESEQSISKNSKLLIEVTTPSLSSLKQYALAGDVQATGDYEEARRLLKFAVKRDSTFAIALGALGTLEYKHLDQGAGIAHLKSAEDHADDTTDREAFSIRAAYEIAVNRDLHGAVRIYQDAVRAYPDESLFHVELGSVYSMLGRHDEAVEQYKEAIRAEPTMAVAYNGLAKEYLEYLGRVDLALQWLKRQVLSQPRNPLPYYNLAYAYIGADSLNHAVTALEQALEISPEYTEGLTLLGHTFRMMGRYNESAAAFNRAFKVNEENVEPQYYMGIAYQMKGDKARSRDSYDRFRRITQWRSEDNFENASYLIELALVLTRLGQPRNAQKAASKAAESGSISHYEWARLYSLQGKKEASFKELQKAIDGGFRDLIILKCHPDFRLIRTDPRFSELWSRYIKT